MRAAGDSARVQANEVAKEREIYVKTATATQSDLKAQISHLRKKVSIITTEPDSIQPSPCDCATYGDLVNVQDSLIVSLETQGSTVTASFTKELMLAATQLSAEKQISELLTQNMAKDVQNIRKEKRAKKFFRSLSVILGTATAVLIIGSQ